jgi:hypothetical protein
MSIRHHRVSLCVCRLIRSVSCLLSLTAAQDQDASSANAQEEELGEKGA